METIKNKYQANKVEKTVIVDLAKGKLPPQDVKLEQAVLGAMLIDPKAIDECMMIIRTPDVFYKDSHKAIYEAISELYSFNDPVDMMTVGAKLRAKNKMEVAGGDFYLIELIQKVASGAHIEIHSRLLQQFYVKRQIILDASMMLSSAYDDDRDSLELLSEWGNRLDILNGEISSGRKNLSWSDGLDQVEKRVEFLTHKSPEELTGAKTGFEVVDMFTAGWQNGELIVDAARPGMGKSAKMLKCALENARMGSHVGIMSGEMSTIQLITRSVAIDTDFHLNQLTKKGFEKPEYFVTLNAHKHRMKGFTIDIDDTPSPDIRHVQATFRMWKRKHGMKIGFVDYLQLLSDVSVRGNREQEIASITRKLKALAKELDIPIVALAQLSRATETRGSGKRPMLSDLRESGSIEQDADIVTFTYRPEYYGLEVDEELLEMGANTEIIFAKYRGGAPNTTIGVYWQGDKTKFSDPIDPKAKAYVDEHKEELPQVNPNDAFYSINDDSNEEYNPEVGF